MQAIIKRPRGRPTKYELIFVDKIDDYLATTGREQTALPSREGFAKYIGATVDNLNDWMKRDLNFSQALKKIDNFQKLQLMDDGMYGGKEVNPGMAIFLLKANHGMRDGSGPAFLPEGTEGVIIFRPTRNYANRVASS